MLRTPSATNKLDIDVPHPWKPIVSAPKDGRPIAIRGLRFITEESYEAVAVWGKRRCPKHEVEDWFPATDTHDGEGPYLDVTHWREIYG